MAHEMTGRIEGAETYKMPKLAKLVIIGINAFWLAPFTGGVSIIVGIIGAVVVLGES